MFNSILAKPRTFVGKIFCLAVFSSYCGAADWKVTQITAKPVDVQNAPKNMRELGGLAYDPENGLHYAVSDIEPELFILRIKIDAARNHAEAIAMGSKPFRDKKGPTGKQGLDREGLALIESENRLLASIESLQRIFIYRQHDAFLENAIFSERVAGLRVHSQKIHNRGWESIAYRDGQVWLLNEQALRPDVPRNGNENAEFQTLRLQRYDYHNRKVSGQWGYQMRYWERSFESTHGVSAIEVLPDGQLLVLERAVELNFGVPFKVFRHRLFLVDISAASDTSKLPTLIDRPHTPVKKTLLWEQTFGNHNFEGMSFGPNLDPNTLSLLLLSDDGGGLGQSILAFKLEAQATSQNRD